MFRQTAIHVCFWLLFLAFPAFFILERPESGSSAGSILMRPAMWTYALVFIVLFYVHYLWLLPALYMRGRHIAYGGASIACLCFVIWFQPFDRLVFRGSPPPPDAGSRALPPQAQGERPDMKQAPPRGRRIDIISISAFAIIWLTGVALRAKTSGGAEPIAPSGLAAQIPPPSYLSVKSEYRSVDILIDDIEYIEGFDDYIRVYTSSAPPLMVRATLKSIHEKLPPDQFYRIQRSYIVAKSKIRAYSARKVSLLSGVELPVSPRFKGFEG